MTRQRALRVLELAVLAIVAAAYFRSAISGGVGLTDEGQVVYPSWEVARGAIPYVDFRHLYGPSLFFLNGAVLRVFGADLRIVRLTLVVVKTLVAVLVYVLARRVAPRAMALLVFALLVAVWGAPIWFFNAPYATYYATALSLGGVVLATGPPGGRQYVASGVCFGLAATFKQTQGVFAFLALLLFVIFVSDPGSGGRTRTIAHAAAGVLRCLVPLAAVAVAVTYVGNHLSTATAWLIILPMAASAGVLLAREVVTRPPGDVTVASVRVLLLATLGMALPALAYAAFYLHVGALDALVHDTVAGLPQRLSWFVPIRIPEWRTVWFGATMVSTFAVLAGWQRRRAGGGSVMLATVCAALAASAALLFRLARAAPGLDAYVVHAGWTDDLLGMLPWAAFPLLGAVAIALVGGAWGGDRADVPAASQRNVLALLFFFAAASVMQLYPAADIPHGAMILPGVLPLLAYVLATLFRARVPGWRALAVLVLVGVAWPFVRPRLAPGMPAPPAFGRASGVAATDARGHEAERLVRYLDDAGTRDGELLVLTDEQLLYFLAGVGSALPREEFTLYLVGAGLVSDDVARTLVDQDAVVARLGRVRPIVVDHEGSPESARLRRAFPRLAEFIERRYAPANAVDGYRVLVPRPPDGTPAAAP